MYTRADLVASTNGCFGFVAPTELKELITDVATVCSRYPNMGSEVSGIGCFLGGNLAGRVTSS